MDLPQPPQDTELRNIIDKLAQFVARNGPEFEQMTKNKQKGNPKFQFLYGGEFFNYYQYKVTTEQAILKQQNLMENSPSNWNSPPNKEIDQISVQQEQLREQIKQSEQNLSAQHAVLIQQQQAQTEALIAKCELNELQKDADECGVNLQEIYNVLQPIIESCTKDSISNGKAWILQHASNKQKAYCIVRCLLFKVVELTVFSQKLHVVYLVNDLLHHCARKNANDLREALESVVVPMFCNTHIMATEEQRMKLEKLLKLWESKVNYLGVNTVEKIRQPMQSLQQYQSEQLSKYQNEIGLLVQQTKSTLDNYQAQHQAFVCHAMQQIMDLQQQKQNLEQQNTVTTTTTNIIPLESIQANLQQTMQSLNQSTTIVPPQDFIPTIPPPNLLNNQTNHQNGNENDNNMETTTAAAAATTTNIFSQPPPGYFPAPPPGFPDFTKPPPGFPINPEQPPPNLLPTTQIHLMEELLPTVPYYDLPAGLMVPLIKLEDTTYKPLDPKDIRLPPPAPPSDRLLAAVEAFYSLPSHERPRDSEGWEKLGLYEFYKAKNCAKRDKEDKIAAGLREKSRSPSPVVVPLEKEPPPPKRRYMSKSPSPPPPILQTENKRSKSRSPSPKIRFNRTTGTGRKRSLSRSPSPILRRSPSASPPSFSFAPIAAPATIPIHSVVASLSPPNKQQKQELDITNKGHQMLRKMGWGGSGLGANEQGIDQPISSGNVRDRQDQFKGIGCTINNSDPYENFRKNKGAAFITRMKARAEERAQESKLLDY